jgi:hypothetical protein
MCLDPTYIYQAGAAYSPNASGGGGSSCVPRVSRSWISTRYNTWPTAAPQTPWTSAAAETLHAPLWSRWACMHVGHVEPAENIQQAHPKDDGNHPCNDGSPLALFQLGQTAWPACMLKASDEGQEVCRCADKACATTEGLGSTCVWLLL